MNEKEWTEEWEVTWEDVWGDCEGHTWYLYTKLNRASGRMEGGDVGWTFVKVLEQDTPKLLWHTHINTSLPSCDIITPTCK